MSGNKYKKMDRNDNDNQVQMDMENYSADTMPPPAYNEPAMYSTPTPITCPPVIQNTIVVTQV